VQRATRGGRESRKSSAWPEALSAPSGSQCRIAMGVTQFRRKGPIVDSPRKGVRPAPKGDPRLNSIKSNGLFVARNHSSLTQRSRYFGLMETT